MNKHLEDRRATTEYALASVQFELEAEKHDRHRAEKAELVWLQFLIRTKRTSPSVETVKWHERVTRVMSLSYDNYVATWRDQREEVAC